MSCWRIFCQNQLCKPLMKPLETSLHYLSTDLENRALSKGYFYDISAMWSLLCLHTSIPRHGRGICLCPGRMRSLCLHLLILGCDLHGSNPHAPITAEAGHNSRHLVGIPFYMCVCIHILPAHTSLCPFFWGGVDLIPQVPDDWIWKCSG